MSQRVSVPFVMHAWTVSLFEIIGYPKRIGSSFPVPPGIFITAAKVMQGSIIGIEQVVR